MENVTNSIVKAAVKNDRCEVTFEENFTESNYTNTVTKKCSQIVHADLKKALDRLKIHMVAICEQKEADEVLENFDEYDVETLSGYLVTGFSIGGSDENLGVTLIGQKLLASGHVLNLIAPFTKYEDEDGYQYASELSADIEAACFEVEQYLFAEKWGIKQAEIDFDSPEMNLEEFETPVEMEGMKVSASVDGGETFQEVNMGKLRQLAATA